MNKRSYSLFLIIFFVGAYISSFSATYFTRTSGNWNTTTTWSTVSCGGAVASTIPGASDNVIICSGNTVTMNGNPGNCLSLTVNGTANWTSTFTTNVGAGGLTLNNGALLSGSAVGILNVSSTLTQPAGATSTIGGITITISGTSTISGTLTFNNTGGTKTFNSVIVSATGNFNSSVSEFYTVLGNLTMNGGSLSGSSSGSINVMGSFIITAGTTASLGNINIAVTGLTSISGTLSDNSTGGSNQFTNVDLNATGKFNNTSAETYTITGNLNTYGGDFLATGATPIFNVAGNFNVVSGICDVSRIKFNISGTTTITGTLDINSVRGTKTFNDFIVVPSGTFNSTVAENYKVNGSITVDGTFNANLGVWTLTGAGKTISGSTAMVFDDITDNGSYTNSASVRLATSLKGSGTWTQASTGTVDLAISNANFSVNFFNASAVGNTVIYSRGGNQNVILPNDGSYSNLTLAGGGTKKMLSNTIANKNVLISSPSILDGNNKNLNVGGDFTNNNSFIETATTVTMNGSAAQTINGTAITDFNNLTISNSAGVTLGINTTVAATLNFTAGVITTSTNKVTIGTAGTVTGAGTSRFVNGFLEKNVSTGASVSRTFEVGFGTTNYLPITTLFASVTTAGKITAKVNNGDHPTIATSVIEDTKSVNRYWSLTNAGTGFTTYSATCNFIGVPTDADAGSTPANYFMAIFNASTWTLLNRGTFTATSNQGLTAATIGDIQIGEKRTASVVIAVSPSTTICAGSTATFTATPTFGGTTPIYQWKVNGINVGVNSPTYSTTTLISGQVVTCVMTSSIVGILGSPATSNSITMTVTPSVPVSVVISASPATTICSGTNVTFTAVPTNGGTVPAYQWQVNGVNSGTNSPTFSSSTLTNGQLITCILTSNITCTTGNPATSNTITMTVNPNLPVSVVISASPSGAICSGTNVTFTATPTNGGTTPAYQWKLNGVNVGINAPTYSNSTLTTGNIITCVLTSNAICVTGNPATSSGITMTVNPNLPVSVSIVASPSSTICAGTNVTFTATPVNGGTTPTFQWKLNGLNVGINSPTYSNATLISGNVVTCVLTSNATCVTGNPATSNAITMTVNPGLPVSVIISASPVAAICSGTNVTFTATPTNGGTIPAYQWKLNGVNVGINSPTYSNSTLVTGNTITCILTSNAPCATGNPATSNTITMTVNPILTVSVSISASQSSPICAGTNVVFTASPTNGGTTPAYQWQINGGNVGTNSATYSNSTLTTGDVVSCVLTSNALCVSTPTATSNTISFTVTNSGTWLGTVSTDWNTAGNWCGGVPTSTTNVVIPSGTSFSPQLTNNSTCKNLTINAGASFTMGSFSVNVKGNLINNGAFNQGSGTVIFDGSVSQTIVTAAPLVFNNLTINNSSGVSLSSGVFSLDGAITCSSGVFNTNGKNFTMTSTATQTARIAPITGASGIVGNFTVQRFISARDTTYADLASPVQASTFADWNNELFLSYAYGGVPFARPSAYTYNESTDVYVPVTTASTALTPGKGYEVFLSGDASYTSLPNTTMDVVGSPNQGTKNLSALISNSAQGWNLVGNPFASNISWASVYGASGSASSGLYDFIEMYDYTIGDWSGYTSADGIEIGSAQGFWVYGLPAATGLTLIVPESSKTTTSNSSIKTVVSEQPYFKLKMFSDENRFSHTFKMLATSDATNGLDNMDLPFRASPNFATPQLYSMVDGKAINLNAFSLGNQTYDLSLISKVNMNGTYNIEASGFDFVNEFVCIQLEDKLMHKFINLREQNGYEFKMKTTDNSNRFVVHFSKLDDCEKIATSAESIDFAESVEVYATSQGTVITFNYTGATVVKIDVMNVLGQNIIESKQITASHSTETIVLPFDYIGMYIIKIESEKGTLVKQFFKK